MMPPSRAICLIRRRRAHKVGQDRDQRGAMSGTWTIADLFRSLAADGARPAIVLAGRDQVWTGADLTRAALDFARTLADGGVRHGQAVALWAPNGAPWIVAALGVLAAGAVLVPIDDLTDAAQLGPALDVSGANVMIASADHFAAAAETLHGRDVRPLALPAADPAPGPPSDATLPAPGADDPALFCWTSGTTGAAKGFHLTWTNVGGNVRALCALGIVGPRDRVLLPLPMHHAYPFVVGVLTVLATGAAIVLPAGVSGPLIAQALRAGNVSAVIGVPRLYEAMLAAIAARVTGRGWIARALWDAAMGLSIACQRRIGRNPGRLLFLPVRRGVAPRLRYLVSGGARLEPTVEARLNALGWDVLTGYGLAETASLFTGNYPRAWRAGSAGRPLAGGTVRINAPDESGVGEIELHGPSVMAGYVNDAEANRAAFTQDGWFRTGDLGYVDRDGFLFVTGRRKELLVLGGGKKLDPEALERIYGRAPQIQEIALLEEQGALVALVRPDPERIRALGTLNPREGVRIVLAEAARDLPAWQRLAGFALTDQPLPRTRLGKYRRFMLPALYRQALGQGGRRTARPIGPEDAALLADPTAAAVWALLRERHPDAVTDLDVSLPLDLNIDSFGWMELGVALQERCGVHLTEQDVAAIETVRDLLRRCVARREGAPEAAAAPDVAAWLAPTGPALTLLGFALYGLNWLVMRVLFRLRITGAARVPAAGRFVITPNHASFLDPFALAAALPLSRLRHVWWAGTAHLLFGGRLRRLFSRAAHVFPVDESRPDAAIAACVAVLKAGGAAVWFPEGWRSPDGNLQRFLPGIGRVVRETGASVVPVYLDGTFAAWPRGRRLPRPGRVSVTFGEVVSEKELDASGTGTILEARIAQALTERVAALAPGRTPDFPAT
jgi:long-chain acyl-CoA synthetase